MLDRRENRLLEAAHARRRHERAEIRVFARAFGDAPPARVAGDVHHRRVGPVDSRGRRFGARGPGRRLRYVGVERTRFGEGNREDRPEAVDHVEPEQERDLEPRLGHRDALHRRRVLGADDVEHPPQLPGPHQLHLLRGGPPARRQQVQLAELFFQGHAGKEGVEVLCGSGRS